MTAARPGSLRARVLYRPAEGWSVEIPKAGILHGHYATLTTAHTEGDRIVRALLDEREEKITNSGDEVGECPACKDPARSETSRSPSGIAWQITCESCGYREQDSA